MKNFIVSNNKSFWILNSEELVFSTTFLQKDNLNFLKENKIKFSTQTANLRKSKKEFIDDADFVDNKYYKYLKLFSNRLNKIHNKSYSEKFWKKAFGLGLIRTITLLHEHFKIYHSNFDFNEHQFNLLNQNNFFIPKDFEEQRLFLNDNGIGNEQIFTHFIDCFYPKNKAKRIFTKNTNIPQKKNSLFEILLIAKRFLKNLNSKNSRILLLGSYFPKEKKARLIKKSKNQIKEIFLYPKKSKKVELELRIKISEYDLNFDDFDKFFFTSIKYLMPKILIEDFKMYEKNFNEKLMGFKNLKLIVCENFISHSYNSLFLAFAKDKKNIIHIYNEHNCFSHIFTGHFSKYVEDLVDKYYTIGWYENRNKIIKSSSLFNFKVDQKDNKNDILFITSPFFEKFNHYSSFFGCSNETVDNSINFNDFFFKNIPKKLHGLIFYKGYPKGKIFRDKDSLYNHFPKEIKILNPEIQAKSKMENAKLLIIDYLSSSYLEGIISDIPTIVLYDSKTYPLKKEYKLFFQPLINSGIFQTSPLEAAKLLERIHLNPKSWWESDKVAAGRKIFLKNIDTSDLLIDQLISQI